MKSESSPQELAQALLDSIREDMRHPFEGKPQMDLYQRSRELTRKYSATVEIEYLGSTTESPDWFFIRFASKLRISGQLVSDRVRTADLEYWSEETGLLTLPVDEADQESVNKFVRQVLICG